MPASAPVIHAQTRFVEISREAVSPAGAVPANPAASAEPEDLELDANLFRRVREL